MDNSITLPRDSQGINLGEIECPSCKAEGIEAIFKINYALEVKGIEGESKVDGTMTCPLCGTFFALSEKDAEDLIRDFE